MMHSSISTSKALDWKSLPQEAFIYLYIDGVSSLVLYTRS